MAFKTKSKPAGRRRGNRSSRNDNGAVLASDNAAGAISDRNGVGAVVAVRKPEAKIARPDSRIKPQPSFIEARLSGVTKPVQRVQHGVFRFFYDIRAELRKVVWPSRKELINLTLIVVAVSAAMGIFLGGVDYLFRKVFELLVSV